MDNLDILGYIFDKCNLNTKLILSITSKSFYKLTSPFFKHDTLTKRCEIITAMILDKCTKNSRTTITAPTSISMIKLIMNYARGIAKSGNIVIVASVKAQKIWIEELKSLDLFNIKDAKKSLVLWNNSNKGAHLDYLNQTGNYFSNHHIILSSKSMFAISDKDVNTIIIDLYCGTLISREIERHKVPHVITLLPTSKTNNITVT